MSTIGFWTNSVWRLNVADNGNVGIGKITPLYPLHMGSGAHVTSGGVWTNASSEKLKENFANVDPRDMLDRVSSMPIKSWNYKVEDDAIHHIGPTSENFHKAFGLGASDKHIGTLDADGVALAAIQGLYEIVKEKDAEIGALEARVTELENVVRNMYPPARATTLGMAMPALALAGMFGLLAIGRRRKGGAR